MLTLEETLKYRNPRVVKHFTNYYFNFSPKEADDIFIEMIRWLWLCSKAYQDRRSGNPVVPKTMNIQSGMIVLDLIWHIFIIHTRDYAEFCDKHFGEMIHHSPANSDYIPPEQNETEMQMSYIYDHAGGEATLKKWYVYYTEKYPLERIRELQKPFEIELL
jgi:hypothetical protein